MNTDPVRKLTQLVPPPENVDVDEKVWKAWLEKGRQHDRIISKRLKAATYFLVILVSGLVSWTFLRR
jgi:hypothetical protein